MKNNEGANSKKQGDEFEDNFCTFLLHFLPQIFGEGFAWHVKPCRQTGGSEENGRDINAEWTYKEDENSEEEYYKWWFECKSHRNPKGKGAKKHLHKKEVADKILYTLTAADDVRPKCYCIVSPFIELQPWLRDQLPMISNLKNTQFVQWTQKHHLIDECVATNSSIRLLIYPDIDDFIVLGEENSHSNLGQILSFFRDSNKKGAGGVKNTVEATYDLNLKKDITTAKKQNEGILKEIQDIQEQLKYYPSE